MAFSRRGFLETCAVLGPAVWHRGTQEVYASPTVFFGHPGGQSNLVRFRAENTDAPAGRLRVYDTRRQLLGTAGMLGVDGRLFGELWLDIQGPTRVTAELEMPGRRTPLRSSHLLTIPRKWTLHWVTVTDPETLLDRLSGLNTWDRAAVVSFLSQTGVKGNPFGGRGKPTDGADHVEYLRASTRAMELERRFGIPASAIAIAQSPDLRASTAPLALAGAGIRYALLLDDEHHAFYVYEGRDGSRIVTASPPPGGNPRQLQFAAGRDTMAGAVESWLTTSPALEEQIYPLDAALIVSDAIEDNRLAMMHTLQEWLQRFAYPRIIVGDVDEFFARAERLATDRPLFGVGNPMPFQHEPTLNDLRTRVASRVHAQRVRVENMVGALTRLLGREGKQLSDFASAVDFAFDGTLVFNPSPLPRTDVITVTDGTERMVTRVPGLGYVFVPDAAPAPDAPYLEPGDAAIAGQRFTVRLNPETGSISSLYARDAGRDLAVDALGGLNDITTARLISLQRFRLPGVGSRLITQRRTTWGVVDTTYTVFDDVPWVDIQNSINNLGRTPVRYEFALNLNTARVLWETAAGYEVQAPPTTNVAHLRWVHVQDQDRSGFLLRCLEHPTVRVELAVLEGSGDETDRAKLISITPGGTSRYRINTTSPTDAPDEPWRFGWHGEPFVTTEVTRGGRVPVGRFGQILTIEPGVMLVGVKEADDDFGIILYLQEVMGYTRTIRVSPDMIQFAHARLVDLAERDLGESLDVTEDGVRVPINRFGITALRLAELNLR